MMGTLFVLAGLLQIPPANAPAIDMARMVSFEASQFQMGTPPDLNVGRYGDGWYVNEVPEFEVQTLSWAAALLSLRTAQTV